MRVDDLLVEAVAQLFAAPLAEFVDRRKQLAAAAKQRGDRTGAAQLGKLARPSASAWAVNALWRHAADEWSALVELTRAIAAGDLTAGAEHRTALGRLRARAIELARAVEQPTSDAMLARLETNLRGLAATGWGDIVPGQMVADLEPLGFDVMAGFAVGARAIAPPSTGAVVIAVAPVPDPEIAARAARRTERLATVAARQRAAVAAHAALTESAAALAQARAHADRAELAHADARARTEAADREVAAATVALQIE